MFVDYSIIGIYLYSEYDIVPYCMLSLVTDFIWQYRTFRWNSSFDEQERTHL